jgi:hypothetical protein
MYPDHKPSYDYDPFPEAREFFDNSAEFRAVREYTEEKVKELGRNITPQEQAIYSTEAILQRELGRPPTKEEVEKRLDDEGWTDLFLVTEAAEEAEIPPSHPAVLQCLTRLELERRLGREPTPQELREDLKQLGL